MNTAALLATQQDEAKAAIASVDVNAAAASLGPNPTAAAIMACWIGLVQASHPHVSRAGPVVGSQLSVLWHKLLDILRGLLNKQGARGPVVGSVLSVLLHELLGSLDWSKILSAIGPEAIALIRQYVLPLVQAQLGSAAAALLSALLDALSGAIPKPVA